MKINAFKADEDVAPVAVATLTAAERQKHERDEEMKKLMALRKQAQAQEADVPEVKKESADPKKISSPLKPVAADAAEKDRKRLEEIRARNAKLEGDDGTASLEAEKASVAKKATEEAERAAATRRAAEDAEKAATAKKAAEEAERAAAAKKAAEEAERASAAKKAAEDAERAAAAKKAAEEAERAAAAKKAAEEAERAAAAKKAAEEAERAAAAKKAAEDAERAAAAKKAAEEAERAAAAKKAAEDAERAAAVEEERKAQEQIRLAEIAAKEEALRAEKAEKVRLAQLEQQKREEEEAIAEELAYQQEQEQQRLQLEEQRKKREEAEAKRQLEQQESLRQQAELEEQQRRMDEKLARQKEALAEAAANEQREQRERELQQQRQQAEAQERERVRQEELAARQAAEQAEIARLREEEATRQQELLEAQRREEEEHAAEVLRLEQERLAAAEEARKAEEAISQYENAALEEKKRRAEAQRKKREAFLSEMDSFSTTFEAKTQVEDETIKAEQDKHYELLAQQMKQVEEAKAATLAKEAQEKEQREAQRIAAAELAAAELARANVPPPVPTVLPVQAAAPAEDTYSINLNTSSEEPKKDLLADLTSSLFKPAVVPVPFPTPVVAATIPAAVQSTQKEETVRPDSISPAMDAIEEEGEGEEETEPTATAFGSEELRVPTRIGSGKAKVKPIVAKPVAVSIINARTAAATVKYSEDEEEEGTGEAGSISNVLTLEERRKLTLAQKDTWRAKQADLTEKRKEFHGVVTYTFDGVFAWQMYGSAEAVDESGAAYTEYLMRCQWGTTFENMQPWIVAHRYKEFDKLDQQLKAKFPRLEPNMPKLPKKELFRSLQADVVAERRGVLEEYMSKIVNSMPSLLRSELMNDFLDITNRISGIRLMLLKASNALVEARHTPPPTPTPSRPVSVTPQQKASGSGVSSNSKYGIEDPLAFRAQPVDPLGCFLGDVEEETLVCTSIVSHFLGFSFFCFLTTTTYTVSFVL